MKLYLTPHACSLAVDIVARELEIPLDLEWVDVRAKRLRDGSDYYKINPKGRCRPWNFATASASPKVP